MKPRRTAALILLFLLTLAVVQQTSARGEEASEAVIWTSWDAAHFALIDDGNVLWIGTGSGLVQYNKATGSRLRHSTIDGVPHRHIFCGAVDGKGNRWFGGDGGLSKLDAAGKWTHYNRDNSPLAGDQVSAIAVTAAGDIWLSYKDLAAVSRLRSNGSWSNYPNRETAVSLAYDNIKETLNSNDLWTAAGDEIWVGYNVFNGTQWLNRTPENSWAAPQGIEADSRNNVWAIGNIDYAYGVLEWDGTQWVGYELNCEACVEAHLTQLAVDNNDVVWVGGEVTYPYSRGCPVYGRVPDKPGSFSLERSIGGVLSGISDMKATEEGLWITGANWLIGPDSSLQKFAEVPYLNNTTRLVVNGHGTTWLHSGRFDGVLQTLDDRGTGTLRDDSGQVVAGNMASVEMETAANGDLWLAWKEDAVRYQIGHGPTRFVNGAPVDYIPPLDYAFIHDIYVEDDRHTWFIYEPFFDVDVISAGIWRLDDGGTPADVSDDVWTTYKIEGTGDDGSVAARDGKLWYGDSTGVYLYSGDSWQQLDTKPAEALIPSKNGVLFVQRSNGALMIEADGDQYWRPVPEIVLNNYSLVRSTARRNRLWRNTADGAIWYWHFNGELGRWDGHFLQTYESPTYGGYIEVDQNNHVWLIEESGQWEDNTLWRMSPRPDFRLSAGPSTWFITPHGRRTIAVNVSPIEGYTNKVSLSITGLPSGITTQVNPAEIVPGQQAMVTMTAYDAVPGTTTIVFQASSSDIVHEQKITLAVVGQTHESWLPVMSNKQ